MCIVGMLAAAAAAAVNILVFNAFFNCYSSSYLSLVMASGLRMLVKKSSPIMQYQHDFVIQEIRIKEKGHIQ